MPPDLPPVQNRPLYCYRVFMKWLSFFIFGLGSFLLSILILPVMRLTIHPAEKFKSAGHRVISSSLAFFVWIMESMGIVRLTVEDREAFKKLGGKIAAANHPSLLDVVMLYSLIPNADCIVNAGLTRGNVVSGIINMLYIPNSMDIDNLAAECKKSLAAGNCLIIFPEGTRTRRGRKPALRKGAARVALSTGCPVIPVRIGGTDKYGLGKKDPWTGFNPVDRYVYDLRMADGILPEKYAALDDLKAVKALTADLKAALFP